MADGKQQKRLHQQLLAGAPWSRRVCIALAVLLALNSALALWGFIMSFVFCYDISVGQNYYTAVWINAFTLMLTVQAVAVLCIPAVTTGGHRPRSRFGAVLWYASWLACISIILLIGMAAPGMASQYAWAFLWWPPLACIIATAVQRRRIAGTAAAVPAGVLGTAATDVSGVRVDVEAADAPQKPPTCCSRAAWRRCWGNYWVFVAWSSLFWLAALGFFLALQAAWLVADSRAYPTPGTLYPIPLEDGTGQTPNVHMLCKGPKTPGLSTFVMEAGAGAPGVAYAGIVDTLAQAGRRACWYDRLGYGWSDVPRALPAGNQTAVVLHNVLAAAGEAAPYIIAGHSAGGQTALLFAGSFPDLVSGVALLDSYDDVAISLAYTGSENVTVQLPSGKEVMRPAFTYLTANTLGAIDAVRAITPFGWARFITMSYDGAYPYTGAMNAMYGDNKDWQAQWLAVKASLAGVPDISDLLSDLGAQFWQGTGWPTLGAKPVLLLPAAETLRPGLPDGCDPLTLPTDATCQANVGALVGAGGIAATFYPDLYLTYLRTLSSNVTMVVMPGAHSFPTRAYRATAEKLLEKFAGV